ncbi:MAG TPA: TraR/DksA C4-type zinc finger protein [Chloroflexota bacterium]|nr:TraR/DksA C4-type zinc finger protein [Chloroflexota bacterium]
MTTSRPRNLDAARTHLQELKLQLEQDIQTHRERAMVLSGGPDEAGSGQHWERSGYGDHQADDATEVFEREKEMGLELSLQAHLSQVEHALSRIEAGTYGECESCGKPIAKARLDAMPEATLCIDCKAAEEARMPLGRREPDTVQ